ncbi:MAG: hypothetical protein ACKVU4_11965 [Phycisphaerales bacterium]
MKLSKQRKAAIGVLGLALGAFVLDRTMLTPEGASAATPAATPSAGTGASAPARIENLTVVKDAPNRRSKPGVSERLSKSVNAPKWTAEEVLGSLRASPAWAGDGSTAGTGSNDPVASFKSKHQLKAVMSSRGSDEQRIALIDGTPMRVGDTLDGMRLVSVGARSTVFEAGSVRVVLSLPEPPDGLKPKADAAQGR